MTLKNIWSFLLQKEAKETTEIRNLFENNFLTYFANLQMRNVKKNIINLNAD
jgi:hypothetical protein